MNVSSRHVPALCVFIGTLFVVVSSPASAAPPGGGFTYCVVHGQYPQRATPPLNHFISFVSKIFVDNRSGEVEVARWQKWLAQNGPAEYQIAVGEATQQGIDGTNVGDCETFGTLAEATQQWAHEGFLSPVVDWPAAQSVTKLVPQKMPARAFWQCIISSSDTAHRTDFYIPVIDIPRGRSQFEVEEHLYTFVRQQRPGEVVTNPVCEWNFDGQSVKDEMAKYIGPSSKRLDYEFSEFRLGKNP